MGVDGFFLGRVMLGFSKIMTWLGFRGGTMAEYSECMLVKDFNGTIKIEKVIAVCSSRFKITMYNPFQA